MSSIECVLSLNAPWHCSRATVGMLPIERVIYIFCYVLQNVFFLSMHTGTARATEGLLTLLVKRDLISCRNRPNSVNRDLICAIPSLPCTYSSSANVRGRVRACVASTVTALPTSALPAGTNQPEQALPSSFPFLAAGVTAVTGMATPKGDVLPASAARFPLLHPPLSKLSV